MKKSIDLATVKKFILANALGENVMLMLHPSNFERIAKAAKANNTKNLLCVLGINVIADEENEVTEDEIDVLEVKFN
ncbi:hypothetical protein [Flavobacterium sp. MK4S-17]|jgi:hypothetical protein|uniref:hypothetical protein n=1 Tax=Flavobacterium sp. MK4S-17 TaxID=2543737 RepID=UPI001357FF2B|nr:hypothetical protein [Flavobacterium sp. MK4S-17]